jgi:hypothetical protein
MSNKQQTAVEQFWDKIALKLSFEQLNEVLPIFEQAKEMEKEKIKNAHIEGQSCVHCPITELAEEFYNETYGGDHERS